MQGLADGYFILPATVPNYLAGTAVEKIDTRNPAFREAESEVHERMSALLKTKGQRTVDSIHRELGKLMWDNCGMSRSEESLRHALTRIPELREEFRANLRVLGSGDGLNQSLEKAGRVADFIELAELTCIDALDRKESCGGHFRMESRTPEGEAMRDDDNFSYAAAWEWKGAGQSPALHKEPLTFEYVHLMQRSYK
jgi:succinate dehydrogenase / fumarate reductase flavoprotein subunit